MNFSFSTPHDAACLVKLWATGRYGFSLPKKVEITAPDGRISTYLYHSRKVGLTAELTNRALVRIAIAQFLRTSADAAQEGVADLAAEIDDTLPPFKGTLTQIRPVAPPPPPPRVRPSRIMPRTAAARAERPEEAA